MTPDLRTRELSRVVALGGLAVRVTESTWDGATGGAPVEGLRVVDEGTGAAARYASSTGLYGFTRIPPGARRLHLFDPLDRYVTRALDVTVTDRTATREALVAGAAPSDDGATPARMSVVHAGIRCGIGAPVPEGQTVLWGDVIDPAGAPDPFAFVSAHLSETGRRWSTTTDASGRFLLWLRGLPEREAVETGGSAAERIPTFSFEIQVRARPAGSAPLAALPGSFDALLAPDEAALAAWYPLSVPVFDAVVPHRGRLRLPTVQRPNA